MEEVAGNLLRLGEIELVALLVEEEGFALPGLIYFSHDDFADAVLIFIIECVVLKFEDFAGEGLAESEDGATSEVGEVDFFAHVFSGFVGGIDLTCFGEADLLVVVLNFVVGNDHSVAVDFAVALVGVDDHVEVFV